MQLSSIRIHNRPWANESLTVSLEAVLASAGLDVDYDEINIALGLSFAICALDDASSPTVWMNHGSDTYLSEAGALFGIRVRDLHPRQMAGSFATAPEYQDHFVDSYQPLLVEALRNNHPVLVWQGWPSPDNLHWGVLTGETDRGLGLAGVVMGTDEPIPLASAAFQCYVIEEIAPCQPAPAAVLRCGIQAAQLLRHDPDGKPLKPIRSPEAYDCWLRRIETDDPADIVTEHAAYAKTIASNRKAAVRFLHTHREAFAETLLPNVDSLAASCQSTADVFTEAAEWVAANPADRRGLMTECVRKAQISERQTSQCLNALADGWTD